MSEEEEKSLHPQLDDALKEEDRLKAELVSLLPIPGQYSKEADKYKRQLVEVQIQLEEIKKEFDDAKAVESLERIQLMKLEQQAEEIRFLQTKNAEETAIAQEKYAEVTRKLEYAKDQEATLVTDKTTLDLNFRHFQLERKNLYESHTNRLYEKDRELRKLKKAQSQLKVLQEGLILTEQMLARTRDAYESIPKDDSMVVAERKKISTENTNLNRLISQQKSMSVTEQVQFEQATSRQKALTRELEECRVVSVELKRMAAIKYDEREQKARDYSRADLRYHRTMDDLKTKDLQINEHKKKFQEVAIKLNQHAKHFEVIKGERNKIVNLLQSTTQKALEMREKIRIMDNEMEILRTTLSHRDKQLQKVRMRHANAIVSWDNLRVELSHQTQIENEQREERNQIQLDIQRLTAAMNHLEETMVQLRKQKERLVQFRNDRAVQLIERNEEVYILQEKVRLQGGLIQRGEVEMQALDDQIAFLKRQVQEVKRSIHILKKKFPQKRSLESELLALQIQLSICQDRVLDLESQAENPMENGRLRILDGPDASPVELQQQLETLEKRLSKKEESLLEKELLSDAVTRLLQQIQGQAMHGKDDTLALAKDVNQYKYKMNRVTKRMKATTAEMTMYMAETMKLEQEVRAREQLIQSCYQRMERGEPPSDDIENEWKKKLERSRQRQKELEQMKEVEDEEAQFTLANGGVTAAEPRPNAYLPDDEEGLPLPKPYGVHAPFRPTENGSNMRHIRKPKLKPIEI